MKVMPITARSAFCLLALPVLLAFAPASKAGSASWSTTRVSPAISRGGADMAVEYFPADASARPASSATISRVHASISYASRSVVQTRLCWNGTARCVALKGNAINTNAFNGLSADKPMYLIHVAQGGNPLPAPVFVQGSVVVWFTPAAPYSPTP